MQGLRADKQDLQLPILTAVSREGSWVETHNEAIKCARSLKAAYGKLLKVLIEIERHQIFYQLEKTSLYYYCVETLELPKHTAYDFIDVVRTSKNIPALAQAVIDGRTSISKARRVCSVITEKNQKEWIGLVCECSQEIVKKCVAMANPRAAVEESINYVSGDVLEIKFAVSEEWATLLKETKDLMSSKQRRAVSTEEALFILMSENKKRNDPVKKAERALARAARSSTLANSGGAVSEKVGDVANVVVRDRASRNLPAMVEHEVNFRDLNQCVHVDKSGKRCASKRWLEKHHIIEFARGGVHAVENLETLCSAHHRMKHRAEMH